MSVVAEVGSIVFTGHSGKEYKFTVYPWGTEFNEVGAVYFITKRTPKSDGGATHERIYVGQTGNLLVRFDEHHKINCFIKYKANYVCVYGDNNESSRLLIERDLINKYHPPCNG